MSSSERSIPHLRDIFGLNSSHGGYTMHHHHHHHYTSPNTQSTIVQNNNQYQNGNNNVNNNNGNGVSSGGTGLIDSYGHQQSSIVVSDTNNLSNQNQNKKNTKKKRDNCKTLTSGDVKTLERHLSMKKTIRKKIMRDLQQAFVDDPNEFRIENSTNQEQLKAEIRVEALRFGGNYHNSNNNNDNNKTNTRKSDNFLDMLRGEKTTTTTSSSTTSGNGGGISGYDYTNHNNSVVVQNRDYDYDSPQVPVTNEKQSFWRRFTMKNKTKR